MPSTLRSLAFLLPIALAAPAGAAAPGPGLERIQLANGLEALLLEDPAPPLVGIFALVRAGLRHERPGEEGLSHLLEHLLFNGTDTMTQEQLYARTDRMGAYSNATTRADHTLFQMLVPRSHLEEALAIHAAMLFRSTLPEDRFDKERGIVLEEIAKDQASPETRIDEAFRAFAWEGTPLGRPVIGSPATLQSIPRKAVLEYWRRRYTPGNTTVLVVGAVKRQDLEAALERSYGSIPAAPGPEPERAVLAPATRAEWMTLPGSGPRVELRVQFPGPDPLHPDAWALDVLGSLLSGGPGPSLEAALGAQGIPGATGSAGLERVAGGSVFALQVSAPAGSEAARVLEATLHAARAAAPSAEDLRAVHTRLLVAGAFLAEKPHYYGLEKASLLVNGGALALEAEAAAQAAVDGARLAAAAGRWLVGRPFRALAQGAGLESGRRTLSETAAAPPPAPAKALRRARTRLGNGLTLAVTSNPASRVLAIHVLVAGRGEAEGSGEAGLADLVHRLLGKRGDEFARELAEMGALLKTTDEPSIPFDDYYDVPDFGYLRLETIDDFAARAAPALGRLLALPAASEAELDSARQEQLAVLHRDASSAAAHSSRLLAAALHGETSSLARSPRGVPGTLQQVDRARLLEFAARYLDPRAMIVTVETGRDPDQLIALLGPVLAGLPVPPQPRPRLAPAPPAPGGTARERLGGSQSYVRMGRAMTVPPADRAAFTLAAAVLSERLAADIREKRGQAYTIGAGASFRPAPLLDAWAASAGTRPENAAAVETAMRELLATLVARGPAEEEVRLAAARLLGRELMRSLTGIGRAYHAGVDLWRGEAPGASLERLESLERVPVSRVAAALKRYFAPRDLRVVRVE